jgi:acyl-CoA thioester hydrolase
MIESPPPHRALSGFAFTIELPILWGDQDAFGHVNNTLSFRWFESARIAYLERSGMAALMQACDVGPILASVNCNFRRQLRYPDSVQIGARISRLGRTSFTMEHAVYSVSQQTVASDGSSTVVVFDYKTHRPQRISDDLRTAAERFDPAGMSGVER